jgi:HSP20 family protein
MAMQRWDPWSSLAEMERRMDEAMRYPTMSRWPAVWWRTAAEDMAVSPAIEIIDKKDKLMVRAEVPGVKPEDIDISVSDSTLTIKGERKTESEVKEDDYYRREMSYGRFSRSVALPTKVQADKVDACYDDGILEITLSKAHEAKPKKVAVKAKKSKSK